MYQQGAQNPYSNTFNYQASLPPDQKRSIQNSQSQEAANANQYSPPQYNRSFAERAYNSPQTYGVVGEGGTTNSQMHKDQHVNNEGKFQI